MSKCTLPGTILSIVTLASVLALIEPGRPLWAAELYPSVQARSDAEQKIAASLDQSVKNFEFLDTPLTDVVELLEDVHDFTIVIDRASLEAATIDPSIPITQEFRGIPLRSALRITLEPLQLTYAIRNDVLVITTEQSPNAYEVRCYNVGPLVREGRTSDHLAAIVTQLRRPVRPVHAAHRGGGEEEGFGPSFEMGPNRHVTTFGDLLIVRDTEFGHQHVAKLLAALREALQIDPKSASTKTDTSTAQKTKKPSPSAPRAAKADDPFGVDDPLSAETLEGKVENDSEQ